MNYDQVLNRTAKEIPPSGIRKFFDVVATMPDAISLGVGEPDFVTPWAIREDAIKSIQRGYTQYTSNSGLMELREQIARYFGERFSLTYSAKNEILVTVGASEAIDLSLRALVNPGDEVLVPEPCFVAYAPCVSLAGGVPVALSCRAEENFKLTPAELEAHISTKTKAIILPFPNNPTGAILDRTDLEGLAAVLKRYPDVIVISDEIYAELTYGMRHTSIAQLSGMRERTIVISGFSKSFAMTGWRLGFLAAPKEFVSVMLKIHQYGIMCAPTASQYAGLSALTNGFDDDFLLVEKMREEYDRRRRFMVSALNEIGLTCFEPLGAFYVFPSVESSGLTGEVFADQLLRSEKVAVVPGSAFGGSGEKFVRCSYASSMKNLETALSRIERYLAKKRGKA